jgi:probable F420-dependent oxidoreductase
MNDHFFAPGQKAEAPQLECFTTLSAIAAITRRVRIAPAMAAVSFRNPALLAKMAATLDVISNGRLILGVGAGWLRDEYHAHDYPYPTNRQRLDQLREAIKLIKVMWTEEVPTYHGPFFKIEKAYNHPRPIQKPHPPIMVGGSGHKLLEISAAEADIANLAPPLTRGHLETAALVKFDKPRLKRKIAMLHELAAAAGRAPESIELSSLCTLMLSREKSEADGAAAGMMRAIGFPSPEAVRESPSVLCGTPEQVLQELRSRVEELGITYFILSGGAAAIDLFATEIMPAFGAR